MDIRLTTAASVDNPVQHDIELTNGRMVLVDEIEAIAQHLRVRLQFFLGEWFLDLSEGIPFFREVFTRVRSLSVVRSIFRQAILDTPGIVQLEEFEMLYAADTRTLTVNAFRAVTESGRVLTAEDFVQFLVEV